MMKIYSFCTIHKVYIRARERTLSYDQCITTYDWLNNLPVLLLIGVPESHGCSLS